MSETLLGFVVEMDNDALARLWVDFNRWEWPRDLPAEFKPYWWSGDFVDARQTRDRKSGFMAAFMDFAKASASPEQIDREWMAANPGFSRKRKART